MHTTGIILSALKQILQPLGHRESGSDIHICLFVLQLREGDGRRLNSQGHRNTQKEVISKVMIYYVSLARDWTTTKMRYQSQSASAADHTLTLIVPCD